MRMCTWVIVFAFVFAPIAFAPAAAGAQLDRQTAHGRNDGPAITKVSYLAQRGDAHSQTELGFMYATGRDVSQNFERAVDWYRRAAEQGEPTGQYLLGLMYDKGQGVPQDAILAHKWLILAAAKATGRQREYYARVRDAVAFKLTPEQIAKAQNLAVEWKPVRER
jgi:uncharacterized protein